MIPREQSEKLLDQDSLSLFDADEPRPFSPETVMPMPESSFFLELLDKPIPLDNRIAHFVTYENTPIPTVAASEQALSIAELIGADPRWVRRTAEGIGLHASEGSEKNMVVSDSIALGLLKEEWWWHCETRDLENMVQVTDFERLLGKTEKWITRYAYELGSIVEYIPAPVRKTRVLPLKVLHELRHVILMFPPQQDWHTEFELGKIINHDSGWIVARLGGIGINGSLRWSNSTGKLLKFYPPESPDIIKGIDEEGAKPAGNWLSEAGIAREVEMTAEWTAARLKEIGDSYAETRLNDHNVPKKHYSPKVIETVRKMAIEARAVPAADEEWANISQLARMCEKDESWVRRRLPYVKGISQIRRDTLYRQYNYYPLSVVRELIQMNGIKLSELKAMGGTPDSNSTS